MSKLVCYPAIKGIPWNPDYTVKIRTPGAEWSDVPVYAVNVDMHDVRKASMAYFDAEGPIDLEIDCRYTEVESVIVRPRSVGVRPTVQGGKISFHLDRPSMLSIEINGDRFRNLHLFANEPEADAPDPEDANVCVVRPGIHRIEWLDTGADIVYFAPGLHYIEETVFRVPSGKTIYIHGGAAVVGSLVCDHVRDVAIRGRGIIYLSEFHRFSAFRGIRLIESERILVEGIMTIDAPHYSVYIGGSRHVTIQGFKSFSTRGWSDGIDMMSSSDIEIAGVFMRNSDDCIAIYGSRWNYRGDSRRIRVRDSVLWADVAHPLMIGTHGDHHAGGDTIEDIRFENIDILEHHEPQPNYWGALAINAGDHNTVRNVTYERIRIEEIEMGQVFDFRVMFNKDYNPAPGRRIENIVVKDVVYSGKRPLPSRIHGYDAERVVDGVTLDNVVICGERVDRIDHPAVDVNPFVRGLQFGDPD